MMGTGKSQGAGVMAIPKMEYRKLVPDVMLAIRLQYTM